VRPNLSLTGKIYLPIDGDLNGYFSGRSTRIFQTPPSYGAKEKLLLLSFNEIVSIYFHAVLRI